MKYSIIILLSISFLLNCGNNPSNTSIAGTETTNGITCNIDSLTLSGNTTPKGMLIICDAEYTPLNDTLLLDTFYADESGYFNYKVTNCGDYNLITFDSLISEGAILSNITLNKLDSYVKEDSLATLRDINGKATAPKKINEKCLIYIKGTPFYTFDKTNVENFRITNIPLSDYTLFGIWYWEWQNPNTGTYPLEGFEFDLVGSSQILKDETEQWSSVELELHIQSR